MDYNSSEGTNPAGAPSADAQAQSGLSQHAAAAVAYITVIPAIIFLVMEPYSKNTFIRFHAFQSIGLCVAAFVVDIILAIIPVIGWFLLPLAMLAFLAIWIYTILQAYKGLWLKLPVIGNFAEAQAAR